MARLDLEQTCILAANDDAFGALILDPLFEQLLDSSGITQDPRFHRMNQFATTKNALDGLPSRRIALAWWLVINRDKIKNAKTQLSDVVG